MQRFMAVDLDSGVPREHVESDPSKREGDGLRRTGLHTHAHAVHPSTSLLHKYLTAADHLPSSCLVALACSSYPMLFDSSVSHEATHILWKLSTRRV